MNWHGSILLTIIISMASSQDVPNEFQYNSSTLQAFYFFNTVTLNGEAISSDDWVGAFNGDVCVGSTQWDISKCNNNICALPAMGDDGQSFTSGYLMTGDMPTFKIYDDSENTYHEASPSENLTWTNLGFHYLDSLQSCSHYDCAGNCGGNVTYDCEGNCGGPAIIDNCGICSMGFTGHVPNSDMDCEGNCGGSAIIDDCGVCNGAGPNITCWNNSLVCNYDECPFNPSDCPLGTTYMENYLGNNNAENAEKCIPQNFIEVNSSPEQAFYFFNTVTLNGEAISSDDWVGAFNGDVCVGARQWNTANCGGNICDVPVMGFDGSSPMQTQNYCMPGDIPTFKIFDVSTNTYHEAISSENIQWSHAQSINIDNLNFCNLPIDCNGNCGGTSIIDECGICGGDGIISGACNCNGDMDFGCGCGEPGPSGCDNTCGSTLEFDECGECGGTGPEPEHDCAGNMASNIFKNPYEYSLSNIYPNPFNPILNISYQLSTASHTSIIIYDIHGEKIKEITNGFQSTGNHIATWNATKQASGVYLISLVNENHKNLAKIQKAILIK
ncbi:MAG: T9SS type A sorting domain-containing protein [Candidatus Neomarinimicrobiota bacterium]|nr:T9SS type A sorting domain-containing protein [Candidatus Neomarinimicrobiota bacterium]